MRKTKKKLVKVNLKYSSIEGYAIDFIPLTQNWGRAEFEFCPVLKRGKIADLYIYPTQQDSDKHYHLHIDDKYKAMGLHFQNYGLTEKYRIWRMHWCKFHKAMRIDCYVPSDANKLTIKLGISSIIIGFEKRKETK